MKASLAIVAHAPLDAVAFCQLSNAFSGAGDSPCLLLEGDALMRCRPLLA